MAVASEIEFAFMKFVVHDLKAMTAFYECLLDLRVVRTIDAGTATEVVLRPAGNTQGFCLVLYKPTDEIVAVIGNRYGPLGIYVESADSAFAHAIAQGAVAQRSPFDVPGLRVAFVQDPEGREIEFLERL